MKKTSRNRMTIAAGAVLAGAAIPIAAAGTAWADDPAITPTETQTVGQLEHEGLTAAEAKAVVAAEKAGTPVEVSYDGKIVVDANNAGSGVATAVSGATKDVATAIGAASTAQSGTGVDGSDVPLTGNSDKAFANGADATAWAGGGSNDTATANGTGSQAYATLGSHDTSTATGADADASTGGSTKPGTGVILAEGNFDRATAKGAGDTAFAGTSSGVVSSHDTAYVTGTDSFAQAVEGSNDAARIVNGNNSTANAGDTAEIGSDATTGFDRDHATVIVGHDGTGGTASATDHSVQTVVTHVPAAMLPHMEMHILPSIPLP
jgi:hypothetical protein